MSDIESQLSQTSRTSSHHADVHNRVDDEQPITEIIELAAPEDEEEQTEVQLMLDEPDDVHDKQEGSPSSSGAQDHELIDYRVSSSEHIASTPATPTQEPLLQKSRGTNEQYIEELQVINEETDNAPQVDENPSPALSAPIIPMNARYECEDNSSDSDDSSSNSSSSLNSKVVLASVFTKTEVTPFGSSEQETVEETVTFGRPTIPQLPTATPTEKFSLPGTFLPTLDSHSQRKSAPMAKSPLIPYLEAPLLPSVSSDHNAITHEYDNIYLERAYLKYLYFINDDSLFGRNWFRMLLMSFIWLVYIVVDVVARIDFAPSFSVQLNKFDAVLYIRLGLRCSCFVCHWLLAIMLFILEVVVRQAEQKKKRQELMGEMNSFGEALSRASTFGQKKSAKEILELKKSMSGKNLKSLKSLRKMSDASKSQLFGITELTTKQLRVSLRILEWLLMIFIAFYYFCVAGIVQLRFFYPEQFYYRTDALICTLVLIVVPRIQIRMYLLTVWVMFVTLSTVSILFFSTGVIPSSTFNMTVVVTSVAIYMIFFLWMILQFFVMEKVRRSRFWNQFWRNEERILHEKEKDRYNQLIRNIVPHRFSKYELRNHARFFSKAENKTVVMSNLVDFTAFTKNKSSEEIFTVLSELYDCFDSITLVFSVTKVKTFGDQYFGVCLHSSEGISSELIASAFGFLMLETVQQMNGDNESDTLSLQVAVTNGDLAISTIGENLITFDVFGQPVQDALQILKEKRKNIVQMSSGVATNIASFFSCIEVLDQSPDTHFQTFTLKEPTAHVGSLLDKARPIVQKVRTLSQLISDHVKPYSVPLDQFRVSPLKSSPLNPGKNNVRKSDAGPVVQKSSISKFGGNQKSLTNDTVLEFGSQLDEMANDKVCLLNNVNVQTRFDKEFEIRFLDKIKQKVLPNDYSRYLSKILLIFRNRHLFYQFSVEQYQELKTFTKLTFVLMFVLSAAQMTMLTATFPENRTEGAHIVQYCYVTFTFLLAASFLIPMLADRFVVGYVYSLLVALVHTLIPASLLMLPQTKIHFALEVSVIFSLAVINGLHLVHHWIRQTMSTFVVLYAFIMTPLFTDTLRWDQYFNITFAYVLLCVYSYRFSSQILRLFALQHDLAKEEKVHESAFKNSKYIIYSAIPERIIEKLQDEEGVVSETLKNGSILFVEVFNLDSLYSQDRLVDVVYILNELYNAFDRIINENDCVKLKSYYFSYSAFCFSKNKKNHKHVSTLCKCAMAMIVEARKILHKHNTNANVKIGIQVTDKNLDYLRGGIVGKMSHSYEIVGNTVTYARNLARTSDPFKIQVDQYTNTFLESTYDLEMRGEVTLTGLVGAVKIGNQQVQTYFVLRKHTLATLDNDENVEDAGDDEQDISDTELVELWPI
uniref:Guanylate cyclase domain-containing protein n=1 Tax=Percolomonas cosmopolitus TaxID=63605 RepID=A0A7S1KU21_9EUKA|mmetsp:Transcript_8433/g.31210  ORF Transcript_8433/g.31210 Transcript_8433/m.31210 type:complete len:1383 (+) Transcript_8433:369-4517(+)|eukprot:CAMPEP_0117443812 /NCGR_PEP_ID=MMETSP0759-20121206/4902_1 /TAXON_ID=63605 /ORGANISM="Percolomonas cosmopolitus, Strain WS" /LENGTH=1382 /DNA_ID=CAMNT_0005235827 /DNA_START=368 /DNA_END=4516 /DNA_ORIENTATION=-